MVNFTALVVSTPTVGDGTVVGEVLGRVDGFVGGGGGDFLLSILGLAGIVAAALALTAFILSLAASLSFSFRSSSQLDRRRADRFLSSSFERLLFLFLDIMSEIVIMYIETQAIQLFNDCFWGIIVF